MNKRKTLMLRICIIIIMATLLGALLIQKTSGVENEEIPLETISEDYIPSEKLVIISMIEYIDTNDIEVIK
jgi:hypothetical protein